MPSYEYLCNDCKKEFSVILSLKEVDLKPKVVCPGCKSDNLTKKFSGFFAKTSRKS